MSWMPSVLTSRAWVFYVLISCEEENSTQMSRTTIANLNYIQLGLKRKNKKKTKHMELYCVSYIWKYPCPIHVINMTVGTTIVSRNFYFYFCTNYNYSKSTCSLTRFYFTYSWIKTYTLLICIKLCFISVTRLWFLC